MISCAPANTVTATDGINQADVTTSKVWDTLITTEGIDQADVSGVYTRSGTRRRYSHPERTFTKL